MRRTKLGVVLVGILLWAGTPVQAHETSRLRALTDAMCYGMGANGYNYTEKRDFFRRSLAVELGNFFAEDGKEPYDAEIFRFKVLMIYRIYTDEGLTPEKAQAWTYEQCLRRFMPKD